MDATARHTILRFCAAQHGLVVAAQVAAHHGARSAKQTLRRMAATGDLHLVLPGVWAHAAVVPSVSPTTEAEALWLLTEPAKTLTERWVTYQHEPAPMPVLGGGPAYGRWGFGYAPVDTVLSIPPGLSLPAATSDFVSLQAGVVTPPEDTVWRFGDFPYRSVEASLVDGLRQGLDQDAVASLLRDAMRTHHPLDGDRLLAHLAQLAEDDGLDAAEGRRSYVNLIAAAGGWATQPGEHYAPAWRRRCHSSTMNDAPRSPIGEDDPTIPLE